MSVTSGDPRRLRAFVEEAAPLTERQAAYEAVAAASARLTSGSYRLVLASLPAMAAYLQELRANEAFATTVADALAAADGWSGTGASCIDDATLASLLTTEGQSDAPAYLTIPASALLGQPPTSGFADDPVCTATGNFCHHEVDLSFPVASSLLNLTRTYNSLAAGRLGAFGPGWSGLLDVRLIPRGNELSVLLPDGAEIGFTHDDAGHFLPEARPRLRLSRLEAGGWELADGPRRRFRFDEDGTLLSLTLGRACLVFERSTRGQVHRVTEAASGRSVSFSWEDGRVVGASSSDGREVAYAYKEGHLVGVSRPSTSVTYRIEAHRIASIADADGVVTVANTYDEAGRVLTQTSPFGRVSTYAYGPKGTTVLSDAQGLRNLFVHDPKANLTAMVDAHGRAMRMAYDQAGAMTAYTDRRGTSWRLTYNEEGTRPVRRQGPLGYEEAFSFDDQDRIVSHTAPGATTSWAYEGDDTTPSAIIDPAGAKTRVEVADDLPVAITDADGVRVCLSWDADGQLASLTDAFGNTTSIAYDPRGNLSRFRLPSSIAVDYRLDAAGRVLESLSPAQRFAYAWSPAGRAIAGEDPAEGAWQAIYGDSGEVSSIIDAAGGETRLAYDACGNLARITGADGRSYLQRFDGLGQPVEATDASGDIWRYTHDAEGQLVGVVEPGGAATRRSLDLLGRTVTETDPAGRTWTRTYGADARLERVVDPDGRASTYGYDAAGRLSSLSEDGQELFHLVWSAGGRLLSRTNSFGQATSYRYDEAGRLSAVSDADGSVRLVRDVDGRIVRSVDERGRVLSIERDEAGRVRSVTDRRGVVFHLDLDAAGRPLRAGPGASASTFAWDARGLLSSATDPLGATTSYAHDAAGRLSAITDPLGATTKPRPQVVPPLPPRRPGPTPRQPELPVDATGRVTASYEGDLYRHDAAGQLIEWVSPEGSSVTYRYDLGGRLVTEETPTGTIAYHHDAEGKLLARIGADGQVTTYAYDQAGRRIAEDSPQGAVTYRWDDAGTLAAMTIGEETIDVSTLCQNVRSEHVLTQSTGHPEPLLDPWGTSEGTGLRRGFQGEWCIEHLVWLGARFYDPRTRSFLSLDPLANPPGAPCGANPYHYAWNDPVSLIDPTGLRPLTHEDFEAWKHAQELGQLGKAWDSITHDPWGDLVLGITVVAGVGLMFVPGGQVIGAAILIGAGTSAAAGVALGHFSPRDAALGGVLSGVTGGASGLLTGASTATQVVVRAGINVGGNLATQASQGSPITLRSVVFSLGMETLGDAATNLEITQGVNLAPEEGSRVIQLRSIDTWGDPSTMEDHFLRHGADFSASSPEEYATQASEFLQQSLVARFPVSIDDDGVIRIHDPATKAFGSYNPDGTTRSFFKPTSQTYWQRQPGSPPWTP